MRRPLVNFSSLHVIPAVVWVNHWHADSVLRHHSAIWGRSMFSRSCRKFHTFQLVFSEAPVHSSFRYLFVFDTLSIEYKFLVYCPNRAPGPWAAIAEFPLPKIVVCVNRVGILCVRSLASMVQNCVYPYPCDTKLNGQLKEGAIGVGEFCRNAENVIIQYKWIQSANELWAVWGPSENRAILWMNMNEWKTKIDSASDIRFITFTLTKHWKMDEWIHSRHRGSKGTYPCIPLILLLDVRKKVLVGIRF
jgi:hypothetical protein